MKIGVPGEFHEDRWQRTAEDYERRVIPRTREVGGTHRIQVIAWQSVLQIGLRYGHHAHKYPSGIHAWRRSSLSGLRHGDLAYKHLSGIPAWRRESYDRSSARRHCPKEPQWQHRVAKRASIGTLVRGPSTEALLGQGRLPKGKESVPLQGLRSGSRPGLARNPRLQMVLRQGRVTKGTSIGTLARRPYPQMPQWHPRGATVSWCIG